FGFMRLVTRAISEAQISTFALPYLTGLVTSISTNFISGVAATALYTAMLIPIAQQIGFNPAAITIMVPGTAMGVIFPWAGATPATAFGFGEIKLKDMIKVGIVIEIIMILVTGTICSLFAPIL
ncbi:MAG: anion permease, partial [Acidobacteriota bacterium]